MTHFDYQKTEISEKELHEKILELLEKSSVTYGDSVKIKGDSNCPPMAVIGVAHKTHDLIYGKFVRCQLVVTCIYFNKSKQDFSRTELPILCLEKI